VRIHTGAKPYKCNFEGCGKAFTTLGHLKDHSRGHTNERPYKCDVCQACFMRSTTMKTHRKKHNVNQNHFKCPVPECGQSFSEEKDLINHSQVHVFVFKYKK